MQAPRGTRARVLPFDQWQDHPGYACTPERVVAIFRLAEQGWLTQQCDLFDDCVETDAHLRNLFEQREAAVAGKPFVIQAGGSATPDALAASVLAEAWKRLPVTEAHSHLLGYNRYGHSALELDWDVRVIGGRSWIVPVWAALVPARRFRVDPKTDELKLITEQNIDGETLEPGKWVVMRRSAIRVARSGLMRTAAWYALYKRFGTRDWVVFAEKFGIPLPVITYDEAQDENAKAVAEEIADNIGNDGAAVVPKKGIEVDIKEVGRGDSSTGVHAPLIEFCNRENSKLVNGSTLSNDNANGNSGGASYALGHVHASVRWELVQYDAERLQEAFRTQVAAPFAAFNGLDATKPPLLKIQIVRDLDPEQRSRIAVRLKNELGIDVSIQQMREELGFREPTGEGDAAPGMQVDSVPSGAGGAP